MADSDWIYIADSPSGGIYRHKDTGEWVVGNTSYGKSLPSQFLSYVMGGGDTGGGFSAPRQLPDGFWVVEKDGKFYDYNNTSQQVDPALHAKASGGGGTTTINYNTQAANDLGPNRYRFVTVPEGGDRTGLPPGTTYQEDQVDGSIANIKYPAAGAASTDPDGDGYDNKTGLPVGVTSFGGKLYYKGVEVNPDGSPKAAGKPDAPTWTGYGPKGQGTYYLDGPNGTPGTYIGATQAASSGSTNVSVAGVKGYTSSGGGSSSAAASRDYAGEAAASDARQAAMNAAQREWQTAENDKDRAAAEARFQSQFGLSVQQFAQQQKKDAQDYQLGLIDRFGSAVSDTDQAKLNAMRLALGNGTGDVGLTDLLRNGGDFQANEAAAALLGELRGQQGGGSLAPGVAGQFGITTGAMAPVGSGTMGTPPSTGSAPPAGQAGPVSPTTSTGQPAPQMAPVSQGPTPPYITDASGKRVLNPAYIAEQGNLRQEEARQAQFNQRSGWEAFSQPGVGIVYREIANGQPTGKTMSSADYAAMQQQQAPIENPSYEMQMMDAIQNEVARAQAISQVQGTPYQDPFAGMKTATGGPAGERVTLYQYGPNDWRTTNQGLPGPELSYGNDNISRPAPGNLEGDNIMRPLPDTTKQAVVPMLANGGSAQGMAIVGDPQIPGQPNPELVTGDNLRVTPLRQMSPVGRAMAMQAPRAAFGMNPLSSLWNRSVSQPISQPAPVSQPVSQPTMQPLPKTDAPALAPGSMASAPVIPSGGTSPYANPTQPGGQTPTSTGIQSYSGPGLESYSTTPQTSGGQTVPTAQTYTPVNPAAVTPDVSQYLQEVKDFRDSQNNLSSLDFLNESFNRLAPTLQQSAYQQYQTRTGIPIADVQAYQNRYRLAGAGRAMRPVGL